MIGIFMFIALLLLPLAVIAMIIVAAVNKDKSDAYKIFSHGVKTVFSYVFIIGSLLSIIFGTILGVDAVLNYFYPDTVEIVADTEKISNNDKDYSINEKVSYEMPAGEKIKNEKNQAIAEAAGSLSLVAVTIPVFIYFNKQVRGDRKGKATKVK